MKIPKFPSLKHSITQKGSISGDAMPIHSPPEQMRAKENVTSGGKAKDKGKSK